MQGYFNVVYGDIFSVHRSDCLISSIQRIIIAQLLQLVILLIILKSNFKRDSAYKIEKRYTWRIRPPFSGFEWFFINRGFPKDRPLVACLVCPGSFVDCHKTSNPQEQFLHGLFCRTGPLSYPGILAGIYDEHLRPSPQLFVRADTVAFICLFGDLCRYIFYGAGSPVSESIFVPFNRPIDVGIFGIYPSVSNHGFPLGTHWIHAI